ncbi:hypothetical protein ATE47_01555 [Chryseobacterium sp. IHB B 17019]|uniref:hypothetical protein n=1 Tax=Chryseobacterium sp. IHB B 17019 TaxID=1721091 RepID=UPI00071EA18A|nr:hypothetical protein [Chryseobacterium sp. IHB B 17019]ALR29297.1 hypothetical protein ATE47_01555 [Chryseobacterium sp. IHB B 17019]
MELIKNIITISAAFLTPTVAIIGIYIGIKNYKLQIRKRKDDLFDRRYQFLQDFEELWKTTGPESLGATRMCLEWDDIAPYAQKAYYLFGNDIVQHLQSYEGKSYDRTFPWVPDSELAKPFDRYLCFEDNN